MLNINAVIAAGGEDWHTKKNTEPFLQHVALFGKKGWKANDLTTTDCLHQKARISSEPGGSKESTIKWMGREESEI